MVSQGVFSMNGGWDCTRTGNCWYIYIIDYLNGCTNRPKNGWKISKENKNHGTNPRLGPWDDTGSAIRKN